MTTVVEHYARHLGPIYAWMAGGVDAAIERGATELAAIDLPPGEGVAVDLGAGFGMHALPLASKGYAVLAIDSCATLLEDLRTRDKRLAVEIIEGDLLAFRGYLDRKARLILCMGDTLTHLDSEATVAQLLADVAATLDPGGSFITSFRDYSTELTGTKRFIPVRSDADRILTCFLEFSDARVMVHDIVHERAGEQWQLNVSSYPKLRLSPDWIIGKLESHGLIVRREAGISGMIRLIARLA